MEESVLVIKAENYLKEISNDDISLDNIDEFENFKNLYFKFYDRLEELKQLKRDMEVQGYSTPFTSLNKYGTKSIGEVSLEEVSENSRHNQMFRNKANAKKNILDRVKSAIDSHQIALAHLEQFGYLKCDSCYKKYTVSEYKQLDGKCSCKSDSFSFKISRQNTYRIEIIPYLPLSGNYRVLMAELSKYGRNSFKKVINALKQERTGHVKTISPLFRYKDKNNRWLRKRATFDSEFVDNYEEELRKKYGKNVRIEKLEFHRTRPAIIDDKHSRTALALGYVRYAEYIISQIRDDILKRNLADFKRINTYDGIIHKYSNRTPSFIDSFDMAEIEKWREEKIHEELKKLRYLDRHDEINRSLKRDLKTRDNIEKSIFENIAPALISWDIFKYYLTTSVSNRKLATGPFPYIRVELDRFDGIVIFATNKFEKFDRAFIRRILQHIEIGLPDFNARVKLWQHFVQPQIPGRDTLNWDELAEASEGLSGGDIKSVVIQACSAALMDPSQSSGFLRQCKEEPSGKTSREKALTQELCLTALKWVVEAQVASGNRPQKIVNEVVCQEKQA